MDHLKESIRIIIMAPTCTIILSSTIHSITWILKIMSRLKISDSSYKKIALIVPKYLQSVLYSYVLLVLSPEANI